jgi:hypothetical protein
MTKEKLKLTTNVPCTFTLENAQGKETKSKFHDGVEYMYSVICRGASCLLFLPVDGNIAIRRSGAQAGDEIELLKELHNNRAVFSVRVLGKDSAPPPRAAAQPAPTPAPIRMLSPQTQVAPAPTRPAPAAAHQPEAAQIPTVHPLEDSMQRCFVVAGRALWRAYAALKEAGCDYDVPTIEDARAAGISMFIERQRGAR